MGAGPSCHTFADGTIRWYTHFEIPFVNFLLKMKNTQHRESPLWCFSSRNRHLGRHKTRTQRLSWLLRVIANPTLDTCASSLVTQLTELPRKKRLVVVAGSNMTCRNVMLSKISHTHGHPCAAQVYGYETLGGARGI